MDVLHGDVMWCGGGEMGGRGGERSEFDANKKHEKNISQELSRWLDDRWVKHIPWYFKWNIWGGPSLRRHDRNPGSVIFRHNVRIPS